MDIIIFTVEIALALLISAAAIATLNQPLRTLLGELCGTDQRSLFWTRYTHLMLVITPLFLVVLFGSPDNAVAFDLPLMKGVFRSALFGLFVALAIVGFQLVRFTRIQAATGQTSRCGA